MDADTSTAVRSEEPPAKGASRRRLLRVVRVLATLAVAAGAVWLFRGIRFDVLASTMREASWPLVVAAMLVQLTFYTTARTMRWRSLLPISPETGKRAGVGAIAAIVLMAQLANNVLPLRLGEPMRTLVVTERHGYPVRSAVASQLVEKVLEMTSMGAYAIPAVLGARHSPELGVVCVILLVLAAAVITTLVRLARAPERPRGHGSKLARLVHVVQDAARTVDAPRTWWRALVWALVTDGIDVCMIGACCAALGVHVPVAAWCAILVSVNLAISVPSTPAQLGILEAGALVVLLELGVPNERALAVALVYHAVHVVPTTLGGGVSLLLTGVRVPLTFRRSPA